MLQELMLQIEQKKKNCLPKIALLQQTKTADDDDDNNVATCVKKKHTTINLTAVHVYQPTSNDYIAKALCDDMSVRKKCLITCVVNKVCLHAAGDHWKMAF